MKLKLSRDFIISKLNEFIKLHSRDFGFIRKDDLYEDYAPKVCWNFFNTGFGKFLVTNHGMGELDDLFYLDIFKPINFERRLYPSNLFNHIFLNDESQFKGTKFIDNGVEVGYDIHEYFMSLTTGYTGSINSLTKYYFKLDQLDKLVLPEFDNWEIEINGDDLVDTVLTRKWLLESI
jgi:hypothetical protein